MTGQQRSEQLTVAVVTGDHPFDVVGFHQLFRSLSGVDAYIQHMDDWAVDAAKWRQRYDVVVFYNMHRTLIGQGHGLCEAQVKAAIEQLGETEQGIVVWHHAILSFRDDPLWDEIVGIKERGIREVHHGEQLRIEVANPSHPITRGLDAFDIVDESYAMADAGAGNDILLTTDDPKSMKTIGWTRRHRKSRVFCFELGHDDVAWSNPGLRAALLGGIRWCAGRD